MNICPRKKTAALYISVFIAALAPRIVLLFQWLNSPFRFYHTVKGLDMCKLLDMGKAYSEGKIKFNLFNFLTSSIMYFNNGQHCPEFIIILNLTMGCATALMVAWIARRLFKNRSIAFLAGLFSALYAPGLLYESLVLKESVFLFLSTAAMFFVLVARKKRFDFFSSFTAGLFVIFPVLVRITGGALMFFLSLWTLYYMLRNFLHDKRKIVIGISGFTLAAFVLSGPLYKQYSTEKITGFYKGFLYYVKKGKEARPENLNIDKGKTDSSSQSFRMDKFYDIFTAFEKPNNVNYYFVREHLTALKFLMTPLFLLPFAVTGFLLIIIRGRLLKKEGLVFVYLVAFLVPLVIFIPLARYKIVLLPAFATGAAYTFKSLLDFSRMKGNFMKLSLLALLYFIVLYLSIPKAFLRSEDFVSYAMAMENIPGPEKPVMKAWAMAYRINPESRSVIVNFSQRLIKAKNFNVAGEILRRFLSSHPGDYKASVNYSIVCNASGRPAEAEKVLKALTPPSKELSKTIYYFQLAEALRLRKKHGEADVFYAKALKGAGPERAEIILKARALNNDSDKKNKSK